MRLLISGLVILLSVTLLCVVNQIYLKASLEAVISDLNMVYEDIISENWDTASENIEAILNSWFDKKWYYMSVMFHSHIDDVESALIGLQSDIEDKESVEAKKSVKEAQVRLEQLIFEEVLSLGNIL